MDVVEERSSQPTEAGAPVLVARHGGAWYLWRREAAESSQVELSEVLAELPPGSPDRSSELPDEPWVGTVTDAGIEVVGADATFLLGHEHLRAIDASPAQVGQAGEARRRWWRRPPRPELHRPATRNPLHDAAAGRQLLDEGWTVQRVLDASEVEQLRAAYGELHGWSGEGFEPDPGNPDVDYRRRVAAAIDEVIRAPFERIFDRIDPLLRSFYCKWPNTPETDLHWDWSCVDEAQGHRAYQVWIALQDTSEANGQMLVLPRSHRVDDRPRGTGLAIPLCDEIAALEAGARRSLVPVPLRAGDAVIFDLGLVHISSPNVTDAPRLAAAVVVRPREAPLAYYRRLSDRAAVRYDVDERWYNSMVPAELVSVRPDLIPRTVVELGDPAPVDRRVRRFLVGSAS